MGGEGVNSFLEVASVREGYFASRTRAGVHEHARKAIYTHVQTVDNYYKLF